MEKKLSRLFICNADCLLEEDPNIKPKVIKCSSFVRNKLQEKYSYFYHPFFGNPSNTTWPSTTNIACLHCTECFDNQPFPSVRKIDEIKNIYYVYGIFCSLNCVKGYLIEHEPGLSTLRLLLFTQMCKNVYGIHQSIKPALPRIRLIKFGGDLTIEEFRKDFLSDIVCHVIEPPFIQLTLQFETYSLQPQEGANEILDKQEQKSLYDQYIEEQGAVVKQEIISLPTPKKEKVPSVPKKRKPPVEKKKPPVEKKKPKLVAAPCFNLKQCIENKKK